MMTPRELARIYDTYSQRLYAYLVTLVQDRADARDLLQDLFVKIARTKGCLDKVRDEKAFLFRVAHNLSVDYIRRSQSRRRRQQAVAEAQPTQLVPEDPDAIGFAESVSTALAQLPEDQRAAVHLKLWSGLTFGEMAQILDIPPNTAASRYRYGIDKLREALRPIYDEL